jgi:hypothetical protein
MSKQGVENGALAALYADTYDLDRQAAELAARILRETWIRVRRFSICAACKHHYLQERCDTSSRLTFWAGQRLSFVDTQAAASEPDPGMRTRNPWS